jgi:DNA-binding transcriptional regulator YhcF (GntR family)
VSLKLERAKILVRLIKEKGYPSNRAFAEEIGIPPTTLQSMLTRGIGKASVDNVIKICRALGITVDELQEMSKKNETEAELEIQTIAAHHDGYDWTEEELLEIEKFKEFVRSKKSQENNK